MSDPYDGDGDGDKSQIGPFVLQQSEGTVFGRAPPSVNDALAPSGGMAYFGALEALRGIAALAVVCLHVPWYSVFWATPLFHQTWLFVDLFFVLSGFVIAHVYLSRLHDLRSVGDFAIRRLFRLYPLHLLTMAACALLIIGRRILGFQWPADLTLSNLMLELSLTHGVGLTETIPLNVPSWSISTEMVAYVAFVCCCLVTRYRVVAIAIVSTASLVVLLVFNHATLDGDLSFRLFRCLYSFGIGVVTWRIAPVLRRIQIPALVLVLLVLQGSSMNTGITMAFPFAAALLVGSLTHPGPLARALSQEPFLSLGRWSYSIYMTHAFVMTVIGFVINRFISARVEGEPYLRWWQDLSLMALALFVVVAVSALTYRFVEVPSRDIGRRLAKRFLGNGEFPHRSDGGGTA